MVEAEIGKFPVARRAVRHDRRSHRDIAAHEGNKRGGAPVGNSLQAQPPRIDLAFGRRAAAMRVASGARLFRLARADFNRATTVTL